ncbi:glucose-1-phosphate adenylyltransferase [Candidatus Aerophobetes bacterium]|uniref:Glucose-1-phosphate adenylyltransferase n=1 Tax=Aerophobetes bacterium TaxID=2030807 RepID=A0A2A4YLM9_UNCAE|nr:MAG: glucose-1-phosphate adenylyltransferase [Candidatus Aerophobetes bacterium]
MRKFPHKKQISLVDDVATIILAGGQGTRLYPLTEKRCKPNVCFAGRYRLIDIPISNSLNSGIKQIYIISQYFSTSLNHHIKETFQFDHIQGAMLSFLHPEENEKGLNWYKGTADAIRKNLEVFKECPSEYFLILSGDQLYNMDLHAMVKFAKEKEADLTIATLPVKEKEAKRMGLVRVDESYDVMDFVEKPQDQKILKNYRVSEEFLREKEFKDPKEHHYLGSMGIYIFKKDALFKLLEEDKRDDFGRHLITSQINKGKTAAFYYDGYWEDIGTISSYYEANLALTRNHLGLDLYNESFPIFANPVNLPCARVCSTKIENSILCQGSHIEALEVTHSMLGLRSHVKKGTIIRNTIVIGNQFYEPPSSMADHLPESFSIGENCQIEKAIIDEHVLIGDNVKLINKDNLETYDSDGVYIRDGIIIVASGTTLPDNFVL